MDLFSIFVGMVCGVIAGAAGALAGKLAKTQKMQQVVTVAVMVAVFTGLFGVAKTTIIADRRAEATMSEFEAAAENNPAFRAIREYAPEEMDKINAYLEQAARESHSPGTVEDTTRQLIAGLIATRIARASDAAILNTIDLTMDQVEWLYDRGDDSCFKLLHPQVAGGIRAQLVFNEELMQRDFESTRMILASYDETRAVPDPAVASELLNPVFVQLFERHGPDALNGLADVTNPETDRRLVCRMTVELFDGLLALPEEDTLTVLRWMFDSAAAQL